MKSLKDGLQVYALPFADERAENGILTISRWPFNMKGRRKRRSQPSGVERRPGDVTRHHAREDPGEGI